MKPLANKFFPLFLFFFTLTFITGYSLSSHPHEKTEEQKAMKELIQNFIDEMDLKYGLYCIGDGGRKREKIEEIELTLETNRRASIEESREIHVNALERLLEMLNSNSLLEPFLISRPFPKESLKLSISYSPGASRFYSDGTIIQTFNAKEKIFYTTHDCFNDKLINTFQEPYETALQIVKNHPLPYDMRYHKDQGFENELDALCYRFVRKVHKKYKIKCDKFGGKLTNGIEEVGFTFATNKRTPLEKARKMQVEIAQALLDEINSNEKLKPFLKTYPFTVKNIKTKIHFEKDWVLFFNDGSVSRMFFEEGIIHYFKEQEPTQYCSLYNEGILLLDESFEEAANKLKNR